jgi:hypothetical protein
MAVNHFFYLVKKNLYVGFLKAGVEFFPITKGMNKLHISFLKKKLFQRKRN